MSAVASQEAIARNKANRGLPPQQRDYGYGQGMGPFGAGPVTMKGMKPTIPGGGGMFGGLFGAMNPLKAPGMGMITKPVNKALGKMPGLRGVPGAFGMGPQKPMAPTPGGMQKMMPQGQPGPTPFNKPGPNYTPYGGPQPPGGFNMPWNRGGQGPVMLPNINPQAPQPQIGTALQPGDPGTQMQPQQQPPMGPGGGFMQRLMQQRMQKQPMQGPPVGGMM